jgi:hypothetical protein
MDLLDITFIIIAIIVIVWVLYTGHKNYKAIENERISEGLTLSDYPGAYPEPTYPKDLTPLEKANRIKQHQKEVDTCVKAGICPVCGEALKSIDLDYVETLVLCCSKDKSHYCERDWYHTPM